MSQIQPTDLDAAHRIIRGLASIPGAMLPMLHAIQAKIVNEWRGQ